MNMVTSTAKCDDVQIQLVLIILERRGDKLGESYQYVGYHLILNGNHGRAFTK